MSCRIKYNNNYYSEEEASAFMSYHKMIYDKLKLSGDALNKNPFVKFRNTDDKFRLPVQNTKLLNDARKIINNINSIYGNVLKETKVYDGNTITSVVKVDVTNYIPEIVDRYFRVKKEKDLGIIDDDFVQYSRPLKPGQEPIENNSLVESRVTEMISKFANAGINVSVVYDTSLKASGALLGINDNTYKDFDLEDIVIVLNPNKLFSDTVYHEFGHLFIDLLGGMNNQRLLNAYKSLENTDLAEEVKLSYPELEGDNLYKEILATALGKKADELDFISEEKTSWNRFIFWFKNALNKLLGIKQDKIIELASELLNSDLNQLNNEFDTSTTQYQKKSNPTLKRHLDSLQSIRSQAYSSITKQLSALKSYNYEQNIDQIDELQDLQKVLDKLNNTENSTAILEYFKYIREQLNNIENNIESDFLNKISQKNSKRYLSIIGNLNNLIAGFELVKDINNALNTGLLNDEKEFSNEVIEKQIKEEAKILSADFNKVKEEIVAKSISPMATLLGRYSNKMRTLRREELEREFNNNNPKLEEETNNEYSSRKTRFIEETLIDESEELLNAEIDNIKRSLIRGDADITNIGAWLSDEKDLNSSSISLLSKILDDADLQKDKESLENLAEARKVNDEFNKGKSSDPKKKFKGYYIEGSDGNLYLTTYFSPEFYIEYNKLSTNVLEQQRVFGLDSKEHKIAQSDFFKWLNKNTNEKTKRPIKKWVNKDYAEVKDTEMYKTLVKYFQENDNNLKGNQSLIKTANDESFRFYVFPSIGKNGFEELVSGNIVNNAWESIQRIWKKRVDDTEFGQINSEELKVKELYKDIEARIKKGESVEDLVDEVNRLNILTNAIGEPKQQVPIFFRGQHNLKDQSYDLLSIMMLDNHMSINFKHKDKIKNTLELLVDIMNNKKITRTQGMSKKVLTHMLGKGVYEEVKQISGVNSNEVKVLKSIIENRLYGIKTKNADFAKIANNLMAWSGTTLLGFNMLASTANLVQGKVYNFIESYAKEHFSTEDLIKGETKFFKDMKYWLDDIGRPVDKSKTNLLLSLLNVQGEFKGLSSRFNEDKRYKSLLKRSALFSYQHMGEFYIHSTLLYGILSNIKVKNANGEFIDINGKVTNKDKAMSLDEAFFVKDGKLVLNKYAKKTSFGIQDISLDLENDKGILEVRNLINKIANDIHGNYNSEIQSMAQRYILGKMMFMLRKWIVRGFNRRWRGGANSFKRKEELRDIDQFYSEDLQSSQEGYYTSFIRFITNVVKDYRDLGLVGAFTYNKNKLTTHENANLRRSSMELGFIILTYIASIFLYKMLDGIDEDDEEGLVYLAFYTRRLYTELSFFSNPSATFQILRSPAASVTYAENITKFIGQMGADGLGLITGEGPAFYERGKNKGKPKLWKRTTDLLPILNHMNRTVEESTSYIYNSN